MSQKLKKKKIIKTIQSLQLSAMTNLKCQQSPPSVIAFVKMCEASYDPNKLASNYVIKAKNSKQKYRP